MGSFADWLYGPQYQQEQLNLQKDRDQYAELLQAKRSAGQLLNYDPNPVVPQTVQTAPQPMDQTLNPGMRYASSISTPGNINGQVTTPDDPANQKNLQIGAMGGPLAYYQMMLKNAQPALDAQNRVSALAAIGAGRDAQIAGAADALGMPHVAEAYGKNMEMPDNVKQVGSILTKMKGSDPGSQEYKSYQSLLTQATQNMPAATLAETIRHNQADEKNAALSVQADPANPGNFFVIDKRTNTITPLGTTGSQQPPAAPFTNDYVAQMAPDARQRLAQLSANDQPIITGMLSGATPPPPATARSPEVQALINSQLRKAMLVEPNFNEQKWLARNKMATESVDMSNGKLGGMKASAQKILNHATDFLGAAADLNNRSVIGNPGNYVDNAVVNNAPGWMGQGAKKTALTGAEGFGTGTGEEFEKLMGGGSGAEAAKERAISLMSTNADIPSSVGGVAAVAEMMRGQVQPQIDAYNQTMGTHLTLQDWLGPEAAQKYQVIQQLAADSKAGKPVNAQAVKEALARLSNNGLPPGMVKRVGTYKGNPVYVDAQGVRHVDTGAK